MTKREKVKAGLECLTHVNFAIYKTECHKRNCPYKDAEQCDNDVMVDAYNLLTQMKDYDHLLHLAKAMHTWIFLNTFDEQAVYDELGFTDEDNALLGSIGRPMVIGTVKPNRQPVHPGAAKVEDATGTTGTEAD